MPATELLFLGVDSVTPGVGDDTASMLLNRTTLIDTGWSAALRMQAHGVAPTDLSWVLFTHLHHDHYLGLPQILFHRWMIQRRTDDRRPLHLAGPAEDLALVVQLAKDLLQSERFDHHPNLELRPLHPGEALTTDQFDITTCSTIHPVPGLCYRITDRATGATIGLTGDTAYHEPIIEHVRGVDLLVHEASHGPTSMQGTANSYGHSGALDAAEVAKRAGVKRLALVHAPLAARAKSVAVARDIFPNVFWPAPGQTVTIEGSSKGSLAAGPTRGQE